MDRSHFSFCLIASFILFFSYAFAQQAPHRIDQLLPHHSFAFSIEPALPKDFVMGSLDEEYDLYGGVIWGEKEDLALLRSQPDVIKKTYVFVKLSGYIIQNHPTGFKDEETLHQTFVERGFYNIHLSKLFWGPFPVLVSEMTSAEGSKQYMAWVGLNTEGGWVMMFHFIYPNSQCEPTPEQLAIWQTFINQTNYYE